MSSARNHILAKVRDAVSDVREGEWQTELDQRIEQPPAMIRPALTGSLIESFEQKLALGGGSLEKIDKPDEASAVISRYLQARGLTTNIRVAPKLQEMSWGGELHVSFGNTRGEHLVSVTPAFCAVAETGSVVLLSSDHSPTTLNFLPDVHIVVISKDQLVSHIEDVWMKLRVLGEIPRSVNFITGPSKTADVEQTLQIGAHGPRDLHVILISEGNAN